MAAQNSKSQRIITFFLQTLDGGGAERSICVLAAQLAGLGHRVDLVVGDAQTDYRDEVSPAVNLINFSTRSNVSIFFKLLGYLRRQNPMVIMSALDQANVMLVLAGKLSMYKGRIVISQRAVISASESEFGRIRWRVWKKLMLLFFPMADALVSNSYAAARDLADDFGIAEKKIVVIHNGVDIERITELAAKPLYDKWLSASNEPVILSVGSLRPRKDTATLIKAFAIVRKIRPARLIILGKGFEREKIENLISELQLTGHVYLPGFDINPYRWMAKASVLAASSLAEGCPNILLEALAMKLPIVTTDCPGDTAELMEHGKWGRLVPVGDPKSMAHAILEALSDLNPIDGRIRAADFSIAKVTSEYLKILIPECA